MPQNVGHSFNIDEVSLRLIPEAKSTFNEFDAFGLLLGLDRLPVENNAAYKKRLLDVYVHRASSTYTGLVHGITRELGLELFKPITLSVKSGLPSTYNPAIEFKENKVIIYQDFLGGVVEMTLDRNDPVGGIYTLQQFASYVNTNSAIYEVTVAADTSNAKRTDCILNGSSVPFVLAESITASSSFKLNNGKIIPGSLSFSELSVFREEVDSEVEVDRAGRFYVNYSTGFVAAYSMPLSGTLARYRHLKDPFIPTASPVIIRALHSEEFKTRMFEQVVGVDGTSVNGIPTDFGAELINELLSVTPVYWGV